MPGDLEAILDVEVFDAGYSVRGCLMRTTLTIDDQLARELKEIALRTGRRFNDVVNETLLAGLQTQSAPAREPYCLETVSLGGVMRGFNLNKALQIADALEDDEIARRLDASTHRRHRASGNAK
jgi:hypothetical protein